MLKLFFFLGMIIILVSAQKSPLPEYEVFFCPRENCKQQFIEFLSNATTIKCAWYDTNNAELISLLNKKNATLLLEKDNKKHLPFLPKNLHLDTRSYLMHHKFCTLDDKITVTGSMNPTENGMTKNNNNLLIIKDPLVTKEYTHHFIELLENKKKEFTALDTRLMLCPGPQCQKKVVQIIKTAEKSIDILAFTFTDKTIAALLAQKAKEGVKVRVVMEKRSINGKGSNYKFLKYQNISIRHDTNSNTMHHKVFIVDNKTVITGSYNPTKNGQKNNENSLFLKNPKIVQRFNEEFTFIWEQSLSEDKKNKKK